MFIYNYWLKKWESYGLLIMIGLTILFLLGYWFFYTRKTESGTYTKGFSFKKLLLDTPPQRPATPPPKRGPPKLSKGEAECRRVLEKIFNMPFPNVRPDFLRNKVTGENLELDMFNPNLRLACEYHGKQHFEFNKWMHKTSQNFQNQQYRDIMKRDICQKLKIHLIEVPYTVKFEDIEPFIISKLKLLKLIK